ncbi:TonB-dependent siderophore receptor [Pseudomonas sp. RP23018S]|uniref:TonB-dependent siderophore receptor n=1 Tax=Pseudomonas sp. RP23018S TaxID=3096037 RepID=UPI002ACA3BAA|nr:TonB-dependent siderophore receptor [Pseudomonas sp. RP23018S]MDZ5602230.1 TonB-dependent siderophore receptor [Pseudomonas sp. RP23018S]
MKGLNGASGARRVRGGWLLVLLAPFSLTALAETVAEQALPEDRAVDLPAVTIEGNRLYDMLPSETTGGYSVDAATVGTKTPAALKDIPQSITVYTQDYVKDRQFVHLDDLAKYTAGLRTLTNDSGRSSIYARGYEYSEFNIDGLPAPMTSIFGTVPSLVAFDRVEIMRGPAGLFSSTSELGGIVNMVRKRPTAEFQGHVEGRYGSWDTNHEELDLSGPLDEAGRVRGRLIASRDDTNGEVDYNANTSNSYYGALDVDLDEDTLLSLGLIHEVKNLTPHNGYPARLSGEVPDFSHSRFLGADWNAFDGKTTDLVGELTHRFDNGGYGRVAARGSRRETDYLYAFTATNTLTGATSERASARDFVQDTYALDASYSQPFATFGNVSEFVVGSDYKNYDTQYLNGTTNLGAINLGTYSPKRFAKPSPNYSTETGTQEEEYGLYSKVTFRPIERLALIAGGRFSWYRGDFYTSTLRSGATQDDSKRIDGHFTPYGGVVYDLTDNHALYASYSQVFKPQSETDGNGRVLKPREGEQYEFGLKSSYFGGDLNTRLSLFRLTDKHRATTLFDADGVATTDSVAAGETRVKGAEMEVSGKLTSNWELLAGYTWMDTDTVKGDAQTTFFIMPRHQASLWSKYTLDHGVLNGLAVGGGVSAMSDFYAENGGVRIDAPGYATVDAMVSYPVTSKLTASLNVNNLFDRDYLSRVGSTSTFNFYGPSRSVTVGARYDF